MKIELKHILIRDLVDGYRDSGEDGVVGYGGRLDIRPPFQREFVYNDKQRDAVIETIRHGFPLNVMYWGVQGEDKYEVIDGQQRILSICKYVHGDFSLNHRFFHNLTNEERNQILDYELMVYFCSGSDREKLDWFKTINIAGAKLTDQELRNAVYAGPWLNDAKRFFSKSNCPAYNRGKNYLSGSPIRQDYLETALDWISSGHIEDYMAKHQHDANANELKLYFNKVIDWVEMVFPIVRKEMKNVPWGHLYNQHKDDQLDAEALEREVSRLMQDEDVTNKAGIYAYLLSGDEHHLSIRKFSDAQKREAYERQKGICAITGKYYPFEEMEADHIIPWSKGGKTTAENCQMVQKLANRRKSSA